MPNICRVPQIQQYQKLQEVANLRKRCKISKKIPKNLKSEEEKASCVTEDGTTYSDQCGHSKTDNVRLVLA